jgi:hypothetical protein
MKKIIVFLLFLTGVSVWSQKYKFGKVSKAELEEKICSQDSTANAAILYSERISHFDYSGAEGFIIVEDYYVRIKIYNKEGFEKATKEILLFKNKKAQESINSLKAKTYNLENGKIVKTKLKRSNIFDTEVNKYYNSKKFTMPNIKPGSVIEWKYTFRSPFTKMFDEVKLQEDIPIKKIKVKIAIPEYFIYKQKIKGYLPIAIEKDNKHQTIDYTYTYRDHNPYVGKKIVVGSSSLSFNEIIYIIKKNNIPAILNEPYSGNLDNYESGIKFELEYIKFPDELPENFTTDWESVVENIYKKSSFGDQLKKQYYFKKDLLSIVDKTKSIDEKINKTFNFVKSKIKWNGFHRKYAEGVADAYKKGVGNVADINLSLIAMLQFLELDAYPVLVSTKDNGIPISPTNQGFNYVIAAVYTNDGVVLLDATEKNSLPDVLPKRVLNFRGRLIYKNGQSKWIDLYPKKHAIKKSIIKVRFNDLLGFEGTARKTYTNNFLFNYRNEVEDKNTDDLLKWIDAKYENIEVNKARVSNIDKLEKDIIETIQFQTDSYYEEIGDEIYINPLLYNQITKNPFKSNKREYPVFFDYPRAYIYEISIVIPEAFKIKSIPTSNVYELPNNMGLYNYIVEQQGQIIKVKSNLIINDAVISQNDYSDLKMFYKKIIIKQTEKIIIIK